MKKLFKMKKIQSIFKTLLFALLIGVIPIGCSTDSDTPEEEEDKDAAEHTIDITLVNKADASDKIEYKDALPLEEGNAMYKNRTTDHSITMILGDHEEVGSIYGHFEMETEDQPFTKLMDRSGKDAALLEIRPIGTDDHYISLSGTVKFSDLKYALVVPTSGGACFTLKFEGEFRKYVGGMMDGLSDDIYEGTGTIVVSPLKDMGTYKAP